MSKSATRRILDEFGSDSSIEGIDRDVRPGDVALLVPAFLGGILVYELAGVPGYWPVQLGGIVAALAFPLVALVAIYITPEGESSTLAWVGQMFAFWRSEKERSAVDANPNNRTDTLTQVSQFHPDAGAVERTDGNLVGGVRVDPANMSLATNDEREQVSDDFGDALNTLDFDVFIHSTGRQVDSEAIVGAYDGREHDPDVAGNETLEDLVQMYQTYFRDEFNSGARNISVREYYILVAVDERDVQLEEFGAFSRLTGLPVVGNVLRTVGGAVSRMTGPETRAAQQKELRKRIDAVEGAVRGVGGCSTEVLSASELARAIQEFWTGERSEYDSGEERMRSVPLVVSETNAVAEDH